VFFCFVFVVVYAKLGLVWFAHGLVGWWCVQVASSAQYIIEQFRATTGCGKIEGAVKSMYAAGRVRLAMLQDPAGGGAGGGGGGGRGHEGSFVMWQLAPSMWIVEMAVAGQHVAAGSDGRVAWRRTPWVGAHAARGGSRPLRRALQVGTNLSPPFSTCKPKLLHLAAIAIPH